MYTALTWELSREHEIPCTFAGGIPVTYTRPGQAALAFLDWVGQGFAADVLRQAMISGSLTLERLSGSEDAPGVVAAARALRDAGVGWGLERHVRCLDRLIADLTKPEEHSRLDLELADEQRQRRVETRARHREAARRARDFVRRVVELAPNASGTGDDLGALARSTRAFVSEFGRVAEELDGTARTALDALLTEIEQLAASGLAVGAAVERLRDAIVDLSIAADRPRPGRVHVSFYRSGGFSGRGHVFLLGLDESRHPGRDLEDPVLLDEERRRINDDLPQPVLALGRARPREASAALQSCVARLRGRVAASYSSFGLRDLSMSGQPSPSPFFLEIYRETSGRAGADYRDLAHALSDSIGFVPVESQALDDTEWWLARLRGGGPSAAGVAATHLRATHPWLEDGHEAEQARASAQFTIWDGWIGSGTPELDPRSSKAPFSASRIQTLAKCPFAFFVRHVLGVEPPKDLEPHPTRWLEPVDEGTLLHDVFKEFLERITEAGERPRVAEHTSLILEIAEEKIAEWVDRIPPRSDLALSERRESILFACRTFLRREEEHCKDVTPRFFEVPFGLRRRAGSSLASIASADPVEIRAGERAVLSLCGVPSIGWTRPPTARFTSGITRREALWESKRA